MSSVAIYVVDLKRVEPLGSASRNGGDARLNARNVSASSRTNVRRSFAKGAAGNVRYVRAEMPPLKEDLSLKSNTIPPP